MAAISKKLRQLNLRGVDKATAVATAQYIEQLEKELSLYKSLEARGKIIRLKFPVDSFYYEPVKVCKGFFTDDQLIEVQEDMCSSCEHKSCGLFSCFVPKKMQVRSINHAVLLNKNALAFTTESECKKYCKKQNNILKGTQLVKKQEGEIMSSYKSRTELPEEHVEKLRQADREYYVEHKDEVNQKDRDKYHRLHPNARYYKPRKSKEEKAKNGQLPGQLSFEDIGVNILAENS